jgi:hypothetical protein
MIRDRFIAGVAAVCFVMGVALSQRIEPGIRVLKVTLAGDTLAHKFLPAGPRLVSLPCWPMMEMFEWNFFIR